MSKLLRRACLGLAFLGLALPASAQGGGALHVVDASGGGDYEEIWQAVDAAESRDTILVRAGRYRGFRVVAKALSIFAAPGDLVEISGEVEVRDINFAQWIYMRGFRTPTEPGVKPFAFEAIQCQGETWLEDCTLRGEDGGGPDPPFGGVRFVSSSNAGLVRCEVRGGDAREPGDMGAPGLFVFLNIARIYDSVIIGGQGGPAPELDPGIGGPGGPGIYVDRYTSPRPVARSPEDAAERPIPTRAMPPVRGARGITLTNFLTETYLMDLDLAGGAPGDPLCGPASSDGDVLDQGAAVLVNWSPVSRSTEAPALLQTGQPGTRTFTGLPGDQVILIQSIYFDNLFQPFLFGTFVPGQPWLLSSVGVIGSGPLEQIFNAPALPGSLQAAALHQQGAFVGVDGTALLGSSSATLIVRPGQGAGSE